MAMAMATTSEQEQQQQKEGQQQQVNEGEHPLQQEAEKEEHEKLRTDEDKTPERDVSTTATDPEDEAMAQQNESEDAAFDNIMDEEGVYQVQLHKDVYGLGIYFTESERGAVVDPKLPFYRLPDGSKAPGEASGVIAPADVLLAIGDRDLRRMSFAAAVEELRRIPTGAILLTFRRGHHENAGENKPQDANSTDPAHDEQMAVALEEDDKKRRLWRLFQRSLRGTLPSFMDDREFAIDALLLDMEERIRVLEQTLDREQKCRFLAEKKNILYRTELLRMGEENATLRFQLAQKQRQLRQMEELERSMHLAI